MKVFDSRHVLVFALVSKVTELSSFFFTLARENFSNITEFFFFFMLRQLGLLGMVRPRKSTEEEGSVPLTSLN